MRAEGRTLTAKALFSAAGSRSIVDALKGKQQFSVVLSRTVAERLITAQRQKSKSNSCLRSGIVGSESESGVQQAVPGDGLASLGRA